MDKFGNIILIEDDIDDREIITEILQDLKSELNLQNPLISVMDGFEALNIFSNPGTSISLIILDICMPGLDGFELRKKMIEEIPHYKHVPFVIIGTHIAEWQIIDAVDLGIQGYFIKPNDYNQLKAQFKLTLEYWLSSAVPRPSGTATDIKLG